MNQECHHLANSLCLCRLSSISHRPFQNGPRGLKKNNNLMPEQPGNCLAAEFFGMSFSQEIDFFFFFQDGEWLSNLILLLPQGKKPSVPQWYCLPNWVSRTTGKATHHYRGEQRNKSFISEWDTQILSLQNA